VPRASVSLHDDWFVIGLRGTGSKTLVLDEVFVPEHRAVRTADIEARTAPGLALHPRFVQLRVPRAGIAGLTHVSATVGIAQGAVDQFMELARGHRRARAGELAASEAVQLKLAESAAEAFAARLLVRAAAGEALDTVRRGGAVTPEQQARFQRDGAFAGQLSVRAVDRLHVAYGARGIFDDNPLARSFRDVHAAIAQAGMNWNARGPHYARFCLGLEPDSPPGPP
jgi:alkylation response protein AidB-like acyl-CoA dehydrogenase